jgi:hypothetical protein
MAPVAAVKARTLHRVPDAVTTKQGACVKPLAVALRCLGALAGAPVPQPRSLDAEQFSAKAITVTRMTDETLPALQDRIEKLESRVDQLESETKRIAEVVASLDKMRWDQKKEDF